MFLAKGKGSGKISGTDCPEVDGLPLVCNVFPWRALRMNSARFAGNSSLIHVSSGKLTTCAEAMEWARLQEGKVFLCI